MNLFSQGVDPELNFMNMPHIRETVESINKLRISERHPYAGDLVFTAFSGSHQDAIRKGMAKVDRDHWEVPYLPIDPADVGSSYKETVRVNSQSGKGGVGFILEEVFDITLPRPMLVEFSRTVQQMTEQLDREIKNAEIFDAFIAEYQLESGPYQLRDYDLLPGRDDADQRIVARLLVNDQQISIDGQGSGPIEAFVNGLVETLNEPLNIVEYREQSLDAGSDAQALCLLAIEDEGRGACYGIGLSRNTITASLAAIVSAMNRRWKRAS